MTDFDAFEKFLNDGQDLCDLAKFGGGESGKKESSGVGGYVEMGGLPKIKIPFTQILTDGFAPGWCYLLTVLECQPILAWRGVGQSGARRPTVSSKRKRPNVRHMFIQAPC